jgi:hypothetical protein
VSNLGETGLSVTLHELALIALLLQAPVPQAADKQKTPAAPPAPACVSVSRGEVRPPRKLHDSRPDWAAMQKIRVPGGPLIFDAVINANGSVTDVRAHRLRARRRPSARLEDLWRKAIQEWTFEPTTVDGQAVPVCMTVTVTIDLM